MVCVPWWWRGWHYTPFVLPLSHNFLYFGIWELQQHILVFLGRRHNTISTQLVWWIVTLQLMLMQPCSQSYIFRVDICNIITKYIDLWFTLVYSCDDLLFLSIFILASFGCVFRIWHDNDRNIMVLYGNIISACN